MGGGESRYVQNQEKFVRENLQIYVNELPNYTREQVKGKLRQLYAGSDISNHNKNSYINHNTWVNAKYNVKRKWN